MKTMFIYSVEWVKENAGEYVPPDPCAGGDYYRDLYGVDIVTATTALRARAAVTTVRQGAKVKRPKKIGIA